MPKNPIVGIRMTPEDLALLDALATKEERTRSDVVRRAVRAYGRTLGVAGAKRSIKGKR